MEVFESGYASDSSLRSVVEAAIEVARWSNEAALKSIADVDVGIEAALKALATNQQPWVRDWAAEQLARLP